MTEALAVAIPVCLVPAAAGAWIFGVRSWMFAACAAFSASGVAMCLFLVMR